MTDGIANKEFTFRRLRILDRGVRVFLHQFAHQFGVAVFTRTQQCGRPHAPQSDNADCPDPSPELL